MTSRPGPAPAAARRAWHDQAMLKSKNPNRFFNVNPQAIPNQGRNLDGFSKELPKNWRAALGLEDEEPQASDETPSSGGAGAQA